MISVRAGRYGYAPGGVSLSGTFALLDDPAVDIEEVAPGTWELTTDMQVWDERELVWFSFGTLRGDSPDAVLGILGERMHGQTVRNPRSWRRPVVATVKPEKI